MLKSTLKSGAASNFAHLFGLSPKVSAKRADDEDKKKDDDEDASSKNTAEKDEGDDKDKDKKDGKKSKKAGDEDKDDVDAEGDDDDEQMLAEAVAHGVSMERTRWVSVLSDKAATDRGETAISMLADTALEADQIVRVLANVPTSGRGRSLSERMQAVRTPNPGAGGEEKPNANAPGAAASFILAAAKKARGE